MRIVFETGILKLYCAVIFDKDIQQQQKRRKFFIKYYFMFYKYVAAKLNWICTEQHPDFP